MAVGGVSTCISGPQSFIAAGPPRVRSEQQADPVWQDAGRERRHVMLVEDRSTIMYAVVIVNDS